MKRIIAVLCVIPLLLSGCAGWLDGSYQSVTPHAGSNDTNDTENLTASDYASLQSALSQLVLSGTANGVISVAQYPPESLTQDIDTAIKQALSGDPLVAYAANDILYELGTSAGQPAIAITVKYRHGRAETQNIITVPSMYFAQEAVAIALNQCESTVAICVNNYTDTDIAKWVREYADLHPHKVIECPTVTVNLYPNTGSKRVLELKFAYKTDIKALQNMQNTLKQLFEASALSVSSTSDTYQKFHQLYAFLAGRFDYQIATSVTPAYSLLTSGIGDSKAFSTVYAAMCTNAGLECITVSGTKASQLWYWNIVNVNGKYYHVDLLQCLQSGVFRLAKENEMTDYTWDRVSFPSATAE